MVTPQEKAQCVEWFIETRSDTQVQRNFNVWCGLLHDHFVGPLFFAEDILTPTIYMNMLEGFSFPQIEDLQPDIIFQQDGAPPHWDLVIRAVLNENFPGRWIGRDGLTAGPPRCPA